MLFEFKIVKNEISKVNKPQKIRSRNVFNKCKFYFDEDTYKGKELFVTFISKNGAYQHVPLGQWANVVSCLIPSKFLKDSYFKVVAYAKIADGNVTAAKLASNSVETDKIKDANVTTAKIADSNITTAKLASEAVTTAKIADANVTYAKLSSSCISSLILDADAEINQALDDLAEAIYPTPVANGDD